MSQANLWEMLEKIEKPLTVQEICKELDINEQFVRSNLRGLRMRGIINTSKRGNGRNTCNQYALNDKGRRKA